MLSKLYQPLVAITAVLLAFAASVALAHAAGVPAAELAVPGAFFAFMLSRRPGGEPPLEKLASAAAFGLLAGASTWAGSLVPGHPVAGGAVFVALMAGSIWARRFGQVATRLGVLVPLALIATLMAAGSARPDAAWWPSCGWTALTGLIAFGSVRAVRRFARRVTGIPLPSITLPGIRSAAPRQSQAQGRQRPGLSITTRQALQMAVALTAALSAGHLLFGAHWQWCVISAMVVNMGTLGRGDLALKGVERGLGAMAGTGFATLLSVVAQPHGTVCIALIFLALAVAAGVRQYAYALYAAGITTTMSLLYGYFGESADHVLVIRLQALALGAAIAVLVGWFLLPLQAGDALRARLATALAALQALLKARHTAADTTVALAALAAFDAAVDNLATTTRPHRLHRLALRLTGASPDLHPADAGDALLGARAAVHALAATAPAPHERTTAAVLGSVRRALADPAEPLPGLPEPVPTRRGPLAELDTALARIARTVPAFTARAAGRGTAASAAAAPEPALPAR